MVVADGPLMAVMLRVRVSVPTGTGGVWRYLLPEGRVENNGRCGDCVGVAFSALWCFGRLVTGTYATGWAGRDRSAH